MEKGDQFKVVFLDDKDRFAVLQVSPAIREVIKKAGNRICLGLEMYPVRDRYHVIQCYHCQGFGHTSGSIHCKSKDSDPTCFYCAGKHSSKDCKDKKDRKVSVIKCSNCSKSKNQSERSACTTHKASDTLCPAFIREKERVMSRTACSLDAKNAYLSRVRDLKQRIGRV